ncbi:MAG: hypothetical protein QOJ45_1297 [Verrucomicrobiota bacterium]|jgi:hypothetical protein
MKLSVPKLQIWLVLLLAAIFAGAVALIVSALTPGFHLEITMTSSRGGTARAFYDIGAGINERHSARTALQSGPRILYRFPLPEGDFRAIQFHPADRGNCDIVLHSVRIVDLFGRPVRDFSTRDLVAGHGISRFEVAGSEVKLTLGSGDTDSTLILSPGLALSLRSAGASRWIYGLRLFLISFLPLALAGIAWLVFAPPLWRKLEPSYSRIAEWGRGHPRRAILILSFMSVIVSCYPVVFLGRSFVSANIVPMLYPTPPTLPGHRDTRSENFNGADNGAMMWYFVPITFVQSRALARDVELPLWNRYNSGGVTLLGQGQSMFGDPLHMLVVAAAGEAWAWDLKFLLAKVLFCWGIGLAVYASSRHLTVALLLACSSAFIGFFAYRFNHPAFFSLCYAPWLLLSWIEITRAATARAGARWILVLLLATWAELNSGTAKEAYMLLLNLHGCGLLIFLLSPTTHRNRKLIHLSIAGTAFLLISAPVWLTFFDALRKARVMYKEAALVFQIQPGLLIGLFDDIFHRVLNPGNWVYNPSANFLILLGCIFAIIYFRSLVRNRIFLGVGLAALCSLALVFGVVPPQLIERIPMIKNIWHVDNTFSCGLIIELVVLAGFGFKFYLERGIRRGWKMDLTLLTLVLLTIFGSYLGLTHAWQRPPNSFAPLAPTGVMNAFFYLYSFSLMVALVALPWLVRALVRRSSFAFLVGPIVLLALICLHWRHGFQMNTGVAQIDDYVVNPAPRIDLRAGSLAMDFIQNQPGVYRTVGVGSVLFAGFNGIPGLESLSGPDALMNPYYHQLLLSAGITQDWGWRWVVEREKVKTALPLYNLLNVRYFLDMPMRGRAPLFEGEPKRLDLEISQNEGAWPRAFFAGDVRSYDRVDEFVQMLRQEDSHPFAAVQKGERTGLTDEALIFGNSVSAAPSLVVPARDYQLTNNTTTFTIDAPGPGVAVLTEAYLAGDFRVSVNGAAADYFRVNHAFRGVALPAAGKYVISYSYWPKHFTVSLLMAAFGALLLGGWMIVTFRRALPAREDDLLAPG